jgi:hypothetical protein
MIKLTLAQYRTLTRTEKNSYIDRAIFDKPPSGVDYAVQVATAMTLLRDLHDKATERPGQRREQWMSLVRYLFNPFERNSRVSRLEQAFTKNPASIAAVIFEAYLIVTEGVINNG